MEYTTAASFIDFYNHIDIFLIVIVRFLAFMVVAPVFSGMSIPTTLKVLISIGISVLYVVGGGGSNIQYDNNVVGYVGLLATEFFNGFAIGFVVYFMFSVFYFVGQMVDYQLGYSMVSVFDPISQIQVPVTGNLFYLVTMMFFVVNGGLHYFVRLVYESFDTVPIGHANALMNENLLRFIIGDIMVRYFEIGVRIALPVIGTIVIIDLALGLLVKAVPQMNIFVVGMPIKVFVGLIVVALIVPTLLEGFKMVMDYTAEYANNVVRGLAL